MEAKKALEILISGIQVANKRGAFELPESKLLAEAVEVFTKKEDGTNTGTDTAAVETASEEAVSSEKSPEEGK